MALTQSVEPTLKALKSINSATSAAGRKYPRPGYEKFVLSQNETEFYRDLNGQLKYCYVKAEYFIYNESGTLKKRRYSNLISEAFRNGYPAKFVGTFTRKNKIFFEYCTQENNSDTFTLEINI